MNLKAAMGLLRPVVAVASGLGLAASLPPYRAWVLGLAGIAGLGWLISDGPWRRVARDGWIVGAVAMLSVGAWLIELVPRFTGLPKVLGVLLWLLGGGFMGLWLGLAGALAAGVAPGPGRALAAAAGLLVAERYGPSIFPMPVAVGLVDMPWLAQSADLIGVQGLGAVLLGTATACALALRQRVRGPTLAAGAWLIVVAMLTIYGRSRASVVDSARMDADVLRVGLVQPAISATLRWQPEMVEPIRMNLGRMSTSLLGGAPELLVWHEGAYPYRLPYEAQRDGQYAPVALPEHPPRPWPPLLFGAMGQARDGTLYNAAYLRQSDGRIDGPVAKRVLVPFGEYVPGGRYIPFLHRWFARAEGLHPGESPEILHASGRSLGILDCFEDTVPWAGAEVADTDLLVNITNDAWFGGAAPAQHLAAARWRSIEARRELVRAVNSGYSAHVDAYGRIASELGPGLPGVTMVFPRVGIRLHPMAPRVIPLAPLVSLAALVLAVAARVILARTRRAP